MFEEPISGIPGRLGLAVAGLLAGEAALLGYFYLMELRKLGPRRASSNFLQDFAVVAVFVFAGWLIAAIPTAVLLPPRFLVRLRWRWIVLIGAALGVGALLVILLLFLTVEGGLGDEGHRTQGILWYALLSILGSVPGFATYAALLRWVIPPQAEL